MFIAYILKNTRLIMTKISELVFKDIRKMYRVVWATLKIYQELNPIHDLWLPGYVKLFDIAITRYTNARADFLVN